MFLSEEKISHLSHLILNRLKGEGKVRFEQDDVQVLREIKRVFAGEVKLEEELERETGVLFPPDSRGKSGVECVVPKNL